MSELSPYQKTIKLQLSAADPQSSAWVAANAGTGKTHVLTTRILRLLLSGTSPERLLALTYTKAAASEMARRAFDTMAHWVTADAETLAMALTQLMERAPTIEETQRARELFARAIETPGGLKVQTIHAFCERLLKRFPLEAGVSPHFTILDDQLADELRRAAVDRTLTRAARAPLSPLGAALTTAIVHAVDERFDEILRDALKERAWIDTVNRLGLTEAATNDPFGAVDRAYRAELGLDDRETLVDVTTRQSAVLNDIDVTRAVAVLGAGLKTDQQLSADLAAALVTRDTLNRVVRLTSVFLTESGTPRQRFITKKISEAEPQLTAALIAARDRFASLEDRKQVLKLHEATMALVHLATAVAADFNAAKLRRAALDFDDLIEKAGRLIGRPGTGHQASAAQWVLYKLDGGIDHILVDEAQDTSRSQWAVIEGLAAEFFSDSGARADDKRTLFAVGDEKQSIYGFQGAAPKMFADMAALFERQAQQINRPFRRIPLTLSFRTVTPVLALVDRVFASRERTPGLSWGATAIRHDAYRAKQAGRVEIWPLEVHEAAEDSDAFAPLDDKTPPSPASVLANRIADTIAGWLASGERLTSENRPIEPGDVLILVRRRRPFAPLIVSELKRRGIPVAGADRLVLPDQLVVEDLLALGDFLTLPEDDLALACVLKSPIFGFTDDDLIALAPGRKGTLWRALIDAGRQSGRYGPVAETLKMWRGQADFSPPFEFFTRLLDTDQGQIRRAFLQRLGAEAADALDEFLNLALVFDDQEPPSMAGFLAWIRAGDRQIKRDMEQGHNEVRVMTVHGAKGLEAPIVFLPDTTSVRSGVSSALVKAPAEAFGEDVRNTVYWRVKGTGSAGPLAAAKEADQAAEFEERNRLLYVALTRARDRLYVCGAAQKQKLSETCWYALVAGAAYDISEAIETDDGRTIQRIDAAQLAAHEPARTPGAAVLQAQPWPAWAKIPAPRDVSLSVPLAPSRLAPLETDELGDPKPQVTDPATEPQALPSATPGDTTRFLRGTLTHGLLQFLPDLPRETWARSAKGFVDVRGKAMSVKARTSIVSEALAILDDKTFGPLFGPDSRPEVAFAAEVTRPTGKGPALRVTGKIDRLLILADRVLIIDYKTNRPPPLDVTLVPEAYLLQLAAYRVALRQITGLPHVDAAILWTDGARLMPIPASALDAAETRLWALDATKR